MADLGLSAFMEIPLLLKEYKLIHDLFKSFSQREKRGMFTFQEAYSLYNLFIYHFSHPPFFFYKSLIISSISFSH